MKNKQKDIFSSSEGDAWFNRNHEALSHHNYNDGDPIIQAVDQCLLNRELSHDEEKTLLEVGCGEGKRLTWLQQNRNLKCSGIEPSTLAIETASSYGVQVFKGTADSLPFAENQFDFVVFGFCLYLCDREDLFKIAYEADRVIKNTGWMIIHDFYSHEPIERPYHHHAGIQSFKMDYRRLWDWNPVYTCFSHQLRHHSQPTFTDDKSEWIATSILRKKLSD